MRNLLSKVLVFLCLIAVADKLFGWAMTSVLGETQKGDWGRNNYIFNEVKSDIVILGSSRAIHHYNPQTFADTLGMTCYNCGEDGMGIFLMYARYKAITKRYTPRFIIYEVIPGFDLLSERDNLKYLKFLRPYTKMANVDSVVNDISPVEKYKLISDAYRYNSCFIDIVAQRFSRDSETAKDYSYSPLYGQMSDGITGSADNVFLITDALKIKYLENLIRDCKESHIKLIFTASPIYKPASDRCYDALKRLCADYDVPFINHYCDTTYCDNPSYFADASHLNRQGAERFSSLLASEIRELTKE